MIQKMKIKKPLAMAAIASGILLTSFNSALAGVWGTD